MIKILHEGSAGFDRNNYIPAENNNSLKGKQDLFKICTFSKFKN